MPASLPSPQPPRPCARPPQLEAIPHACLTAVTAMQFVEAATGEAAAGASALRLLVGSAATLSLYHVPSGRLMDRCTAIGEGERIHGVRVAQVEGHQIVIVWGGKRMALLQLCEPTVPASVTSSAALPVGGYFRCLWRSPTLSDMLLDVALLRCATAPDCPHRRSSSAAAAATPATPAPAELSFDVAVAYAHDRVEIRTFRAVRSQTELHATTTAALTLTCTVLEPQVQCDERSLLYSAYLHGACRHRLLMVAGTVFSHLLLWDASHEEATAAAADAAALPVPAASVASSPLSLQRVTRPVLHRLAGHEGVIFRVQMSGNARRICSVSDDRSVRVWEWNEQQQQQQGTASAAIMSDVTAASVSTTITTSPLPWSSLLDPASGSFLPIVTAYGHKARVWRCLMPEEWPVVLSASEDSSCALWHSRTGALLGRFSGQKGPLWSLALHAPSGTLAMGAADASVRMVRLRPALQRHGLIQPDSAHALSSDAVRSMTLRVPELVPETSIAPAFPLVAPSAATAAAASSRPAKKARVEGDVTVAAAAATTSASPMEVSPSAASATAPVAVAKKPAAPEICRELLLDVDVNTAAAASAAAASPSSLATLYMLSSYGRVLRVRLESGMPQATGGAAATTVASTELMARAQLLHQHSASPAPLVSLALSPCKSLLAVGDQRGNMLLVSTCAPSDGADASAAPAPAPLWFPGAHASACGFLQWVALDDAPPATTTPSSSCDDDDGGALVGHLLTGDAINEVKLWSVRRLGGGQLQLRQVVQFRFPTKARLCSALMLPNDPWRGSSSAQSRRGRGEEEEEEEGDGADDESESEDEAVQRADASPPPSTSTTVAAGRFLLCGDSRGSVYLYFLSTARIAATPAAVALSRLVDVHDKAPVSSLSLAPSRSSTLHAHAHARRGTSAHTLTIYSTGRNGSVIEYALLGRSDDTHSGGAAAPHVAADAWTSKHNAEQPMQLSAAALAHLHAYSLVQRRVHKFSHVSSVERVLWSSSSSSSAPFASSDLLVLGFHSSDFLLWNVSQNTEVRRWTCGGDKRSWAFSRLRGQGQGQGGEGEGEAGEGEEGFVFCYTRLGDEEKQQRAVASMPMPAATLVGEVRLHVQLPPNSQSAAGTSAFAPALGCTIHARLTTALVSLPSLRRDASSSLLVTSSEDNTVKVYSVAHGAAGQGRQGVRSPATDGGVRSAISADAAGSSISTLACHTPLTCLATIVDHPDIVRAVAASAEHEGESDGAAPDPSSFLLFSGGGRDYLHCTRLVPHGRGVSASSSPGSAAAESAPLGVSLHSLGGVGGGGGGGSRSGPGRKTWLQRSVATVEEDRTSKQDLRIMCVTAFPVPAAWMPRAISSAATSAASGSPRPSSSSLHCVVTGNSAGVLKCFLFDAVRVRFHLLAQSDAHFYALLSLTHLELSSSSSSDVLIFSGCTSGQVKVWAVRVMIEGALAGCAAATTACTTGSAALLDHLISAPPSTFHPLGGFTQHQSGVDCMCAVRLSDLGAARTGAPSASAPARESDSFLLASGGDDQAISLLTGTIVYATSSSSGSRSVDGAEPAGTSQLQCTWSMQMHDAHLSAVKSLDVDAANSRMYSVGYDQRIRMWSLEGAAVAAVRPAASSPSSSGSSPLELSLPTAAPAASASPSLRLLSECWSEVWDATTLRIVQHDQPTSTHLDAHGSPLLAVAGQGLQLLQIQAGNGAQADA